MEEKWARLLLILLLVALAAGAVFITLTQQPNERIDVARQR